jgi:phosphate/sulfate permease
MLGALLGINKEQGEEEGGDLVLRRHTFYWITLAWQVTITFFFVLLAILNLVLHT